MVTKFIALELCQISCHGTEVWVDKVKRRLNLFLKFVYSSSFSYRGSLGMMFFIIAETPWNWVGFSYLYLEPQPHPLFKLMNSLTQMEDLKIVKSSSQKLENEHIYLALSQFQFRRCVSIQCVMNPTYTLTSLFYPTKYLPHSVKRKEM